MVARSPYYNDVLIMRLIGFTLYLFSSTKSSRCRTHSIHPKYYGVTIDDDYDIEEIK